MKSEETSATVPQKDRQVEEDLWQRYGAERDVWSKSMLIALEKGLEGNKWFSLIDKVWSDRTLGYFEKLGLFSLERARAEQMSLR